MYRLQAKKEGGFYFDASYPKLSQHLILDLLCFVRSCSLTLLLERQEIFDGLFLGNVTCDDYATSVDQEGYAQNTYLLLFAYLDIPRH